MNAGARGTPAQRQKQEETGQGTEQVLTFAKHILVVFKGEKCADGVSERGNQVSGAIPAVEEQGETSGKENHVLGLLAS